MRKQFLHAGALLLLLFVVHSCKKEFSSQNSTPHDVFPTTEKEKQKVEMIKEVSSILKEIYKNLWVSYEVNAAIKTEYYEDETVLLRDLLTPEHSPLYQTQKFAATGARKGVFKKAFADQLTKGNYPHLKMAIGLPPVSSSTRISTEEWPTVDSTNEIWTNEYGLSIYFPYSEDYPFVSPLDVNNNTVNGQLITIVSADREADSGPGDEPYYCSSNPNEPMSIENMTICFSSVTVNDDYADGGHAVHIVGVGGHLRVLPLNPPPATNVNRVFLGWSRINNTRQYDKFISFNSANGGGSEIKVCRISGYLQFQNQQVTNFAGDQISVDFKRSDINKGTWKRVYGVWDPDWVTANTEQIMAVYEEDNEGTETFSGSLNTTTRLVFDSTLTVNGTLGYNIIVKTQDELVLQSKFTRVAYFGTAKDDQGCGFQICDTKRGSCRYDNTFLTSGNWPIYNCGTNWNFTWPYNSY